MKQKEWKAIQINPERFQNQSAYLPFSHIHEFFESPTMIGL